MDKHEKSLRENNVLRKELQRKIEALQDDLEASVIQRTEILEIRNQVLQVSQGVLDVLPVVVFGIDPEQMIVHCNDYARNLFPNGIIGPLGSDRGDVFPADINALIDRIETERNPKAKIEVGRQLFRGEVRRLHESIAQGIVLILIPE